VTTAQLTSTEALRAAVRQFVADECDQWRCLEWDREHRYPKEVFDQIAARGWLGVGLPEAHGGSGGDACDLLAVVEELGRGSTDLVAGFSLSASGLRTLVAHGTEAQRARLVPRIMDGSVRLSVAVTEPDSGSDAASLSTSARRVGDHYVVNGRKSFCEAAGQPDTLVQIYVRTDPRAGKHRGISLLLLDPTSPGVTVTRMPTLGRNLTGVYEVRMEDVRVPVDNLIGEEHGGWRVLTSELPLERLMISAGFVGAAFQVLDDALAYVKQREQFGRPVGTFQAVAHLLVDLYTRAEAVRLLVHHGGRLHARGEPHEKEASMAKIASAELYADASRYALQLMGGNCYLAAHPVTMHYTDSVVAGVAGGASQIMRNVVARHLGLRVA